MTDKKQPKIRVVSLSGESPTKKGGNRAGCECESDTCPECRVQPIECDPLCTCVGDPPCGCDDKSEPDEKKQQSPKDDKDKHRTLFKIAEKKK